MDGWTGLDWTGLDCNGFMLFRLVYVCVGEGEKNADCRMSNDE